jgi:hypothetical protein
MDQAVNLPLSDNRYAVTVTSFPYSFARSALTPVRGSGIFQKLFSKKTFLFEFLLHYQRAR